MQALEIASCAHILLFYCNHMNGETFPFGGAGCNEHPWGVNPPASVHTACSARQWAVVYQPIRGTGVPADSCAVAGGLASRNQIAGRACAAGQCRGARRHRSSSNCGFGCRQGRACAIVQRQTHSAAADSGPSRIWPWAGHVCSMRHAPIFQLGCQVPAAGCSRPAGWRAADAAGIGVYPHARLCAYGCKGKSVS